MNDTFKARMKRMRLQAGLKSQQAAADVIGCERGTVGMWEAPSSAVDSVSGEYLLPVSKAYKVRPEYINSGKGNDGFPWTRVATSEDVDWREVPAGTQRFAMGDGAEPEEYAETQKLKFRADSLRKRGLKPAVLEVHFGDGDSMLPRIHDGDALLVDRSDTRPTHGKIFAVRYKRHLYAKRLRKAGKFWLLTSDRDGVDPILVDGTEDFEIIGRVRWIGSWED